MGQKTNPTILRLGNVKEWQNQYIEKKTSETALYDFKSIETKKFISKFFKDCNLSVDSIKLLYNENSVYVFVSYYVTQKLISQKNITQQTERISSNKVLKFNNKKIFYKFLKQIYYKKKLKNLFYYKKFLQYRNINRSGLVLNLKASKLKQNNLNFRPISNLRIEKNTTETNYNQSFLNTLLKSLTRFIGYNKTIILICKQSNKNFTEYLNKKKIKLIKLILTQLRKYSNSDFFKEGVNIIFKSVHENQSVDLFAKFIALSLSKLKKHSFFFRFLKTALTLMNNSTFSNIKGIKIEIKGRINGVPRAKMKRIVIGNSGANLSILRNINYAESTAFTKNGTFGVKVWIANK